MSLALILGGGAPNMTVMAGALLALDENDVEFDLVSTTGAGMLIGLLYAAPKGMDRREALRATCEMGVSDEIYRIFPVDYKVFHKSGPLATAYTRTLRPWVAMLPKRTPLERLCRDWAELLSATFCPFDVTASSKGLCQPPPWISEMIDFEALKRFPGNFCISAYSIDRHEPRIFYKEEITAEHFDAALAMPFIYAPYQLNGETFIEGSAMTPLSYDPLVSAQNDPVDYAVVFDVIGHQKLIHEPRSLYDAYVQSIIVPLVRMAQHDTETFIEVTRRQERLKTEVLMLEFEDLVPEAHWPKVLDWSYSNLSQLFDIGYRAGHRFYEQYRGQLTGWKNWPGQSLKPEMMNAAETGLERMLRA